jgi:16S rRNA (cytosine967-C5)-methyltransferase
VQVKSLISHLSEIYNIISSWEKPVDAELKKYYRAKKYLGSNDRKFISSNLYSIIRNHRFIIYIAEKHLINLKTIDYFTKLFFINHVLSISCGNQSSININIDSGIFDYLKEIFIEYDKFISLIKEEFSLSSNNLTLKYSFPDWMVDKFNNIIPKQDTENFLASFNRNAPTSIRITETAFIQKVKKDFEDRSILLSKNPIAPDAFIVEKRINFNDMPSYKEGCFEVQDAGSQLVTLFIEPAGNMNTEIKILDACAGAGGKSLYLSKLIGDKGLIYAYDFDQKRLDAFKKRISDEKRKDSTGKIKFYENIIFINGEDELKGLKNKIDILVLDVPCTGTGTIRRNPDLKWRLREEDVLIYTKKQLSILENYYSYLKEDGKFVYITCSVLKEENEDVINCFLKKHPEFRFQDKRKFCSRYNIELENDFLRLYPHKYNTDGFTACICIK